MTKQIIQIEEVEDKTTKAGKKYKRFKTSVGWVSCFDSVAFEALTKLVGFNAEVELVEKGEFKNISACYGTDAGEAQVEVKKVPQETKVSNKSHTTMYVSYAKDIFCALESRQTEGIETKELMNQAIELVKQAKEAFE